MPPDVSKWQVAPPEAGARLDRWLADRLGVSRAAVRRLLDGERVCIDDRATRNKAQLLAAGQWIAVRDFVRPGDAAPHPDPGALVAILASGAGWQVVDKPAGMPVHPLREDERGTVLNALVERFPGIVGVGEGGLRSGVVHRLDVDTSGALLMATDETTFRRLRAAFRAHRVRKVYRALVHGGPADAGALDLALRVTRHRPARVRVVGPGSATEAGARRARLSFRTLERFDDAALLEIELETGFLHQVRASFAHLGHPLLGDVGYGAALMTPSGVAAPRQMLHAARIVVDDVDASSPDAPDFATLLARLRAISRRAP